MLFPRAHRALCLSLLMTGGCARAILPPDEIALDADMVDMADAEDVEPGPEDAAVGAPDAAVMTPPDANVSCPDGDRDGVCDTQDNCPTVGNPTQVDTNKDGVGDACTMAIPCNAESIPATVEAGSATLSRVSVNGKGVSDTVRAGASVTVTVFYEFEECSISETAQMRFVVHGVDGQGATCARQNAITCPLAGEGTATFTVTAPSAPGVHYIQAKGVQGYTCSESLNNAQRIGAICVQ